MAQSPLKPAGELPELGLRLIVADFAWAWKGRGLAYSEDDPLFHRYLRFIAGTFDRGRGLAKECLSGP